MVGTFKGNHFMEEIRNQKLTGERALFMSRGLSIRDSIFLDGESPLKECHDISVEGSSFQWKYPLWYCSDVSVRDCTFFEMARAGIWYTENISMKDCLYQAPKGLRRVRNLELEDVDFPHADETLWYCSGVSAKRVLARGDYFAMSSSNMKFEGLNLAGNYSFDGCTDIEIVGSKLISKDAFWNCHGATVRDSFVSGEYIGWNSSDLTFENCTLESLQGFCYIKNLKLVNCRVLNTNLAFEYSTVDVESLTPIDSVKNPLGGKIRCPSIGELIFDDPDVKKEETEILLTNGAAKDGIRF